MLRAIRIESKPMRDSARGEQCTLQILGACNQNPETTVLAHLPDESHGWARKADDVSACYACSSCHDIADGRAPWPAGEAPHRDWYFRRAQTRTWRRMVELGVVAIKGVRP